MQLSTISLASVLVNQQVQLHLSSGILETLKREYNLSDKVLESFVTALIEKAVSERIAQNNSNIFNEAETKEYEEDLKGLGYI